MDHTLSAQNMKIGEGVELQYLRHGRLVPPGWVLADKLEGTHHSWFAVLVIRKIDQ